MKLNELLYKVENYKEVVEFVKKQGRKLKYFLIFNKFKELENNILVIVTNYKGSYNTK